VTEAKLCVSADSHIVEPPEVFLGLDKRFGDRAPRIEYVPERGDTINLGNGKYGFSVGRCLIAGNFQGNPATMEMALRGYEIARPGVLDPKARWEEQTIDGIRSWPPATTSGIRPSYSRSCRRRPSRTS
jgi:hypothetical protein